MTKPHFFLRIITIWSLILIAVAEAQNGNQPVTEIIGDYVIKPNDCHNPNFEGERQTHLLMDRKTGKGVELDVTGLDMARVRTGKQIRVKGVMGSRNQGNPSAPGKEKRLQVSSIETVASAESEPGETTESAPPESSQAEAPPQQAGAVPLTELKCLLLFANTSDYTVDATKKTNSENFLFGSGGNVSDATLDATYGYYKLVAGDTVVLDLTTSTAAGMDSDDMRTLMHNKAVSLGYDVVTGANKPYQRIFFFMPNGVTEGGSTSWTAWAYIDGIGGSWGHSVYSYSWTGNFFDGHSHENCHNFGLHHSSEGSTEYGDETCVMGFSHSGSSKNQIATLNPVKKDQLGVFNGYSGSRVDPTTDTTLDLYPFAISPATQAGARCIKFVSGGDTYYVSYARNILPYGHIWNNDSAKRDRVLIYRYNSSTNSGRSFLTNTLSEGGTATIGTTNIRFERYANSAMDYATVSFDISDSNTKPVANAQSPITTSNSPLAITLTGSDANTTDTLSYSVVSNPSNGVLSGTAPNLTYTPNTSYVGADSFVFRVNDGKISSFATVSITVNAATTKTVTYNGNGNTGGSAPTDSTQYESGSTVTVSGNTGSLAKTGHTFAGWNTAANGSGTAYSAGNTFSITSDVTLYAQWSPSQYTVTFSSNGGNTPSPTSKQVTYGSTYGTLATVSRAGYTFNGWFTATSGGTEVTSSSAVSITADQTLHAQWTLIPLSVVTSASSLNVPEGSTANFQVKLSHQPAGNTTVTVARSSGDTNISVQSGSSLNFTTSNWDTYQTVTLAAANDADVLNDTATITCSSSDTGYSSALVTATEADKDTTLTVVSGGNGSTTPSSALVVVRGAATAISATPATGYDFLNWTVTSGSATIGNASAASTTVSINAPATVQANFTPEIYAVTYNANNSTGGTAPAAQEKIYGQDLTLASNSGNLIRAGFTLAGWNTSADGSGTDYAFGSAYTTNTPITLYAKWLPGVDATWAQTAAGPFNWSDGANWSGGAAAAGADRTASFTPDITAAQTVNLNAPVTIGNITFTDSTTSSHNLTISGANVLTLSRSSGSPTIDVTQSSRTLTISSVIAGGSGLQKNGPGILDLRGSTNTYSGNTVLNGGQLTVNSDSNLGDAAGDIVFNADSTLRLETGVTLASGRTITIPTGITATLSSTSNGNTFQGALEGSGTLIANHTTTFAFSNTANTFSGTLTSRTGGATSYGFDMASIYDGAGAGLINLGNTTTGGTFRWIAPSGTGTTTLINRQFALTGTTGTGAICALGATSSDNLVITKNLLISATGNKKLLLAGNNTGKNAFSGNIADGSGSVISLEKTEGGTWILSGTNTYTGNTNLAANATTGRLVFQGTQSLSPNTQIDFNQSSSAVQSVSFLSDSAGTINAPVNFQRPLTFVGANTTQVMNIFVGNTSNGTGSGNTTGSVIGVGDITWNNATQAANTTRTLNLTGANGYSLKTGNFILPNLSIRTAGGVWTNVLNPTTASLIIGGNITMASGNNVDGGIPVLELGGTATGNQVIGSISNAADVATTNRPLSLTKTGTGTWTLSGTNTYTGTTTISGGKLFINGDQSASTGDVSVANNATLGGNGKLGGNVTIASGGKLEFDISTYRASHNPFDLVAGKTLTFSGTSTLTINSSGGAAPGVYTLVTGGNNISGVAPATVNLPSGWVATVSISGNNLLLNVTSTGGPTYALSVANGSGDGSYEAGTEIAVVADTPSAEQAFVNWTTADGGTIANANASSTTYTMPANAATLTANYITNLFTVTYNANGATSGTAPGNQTKTRDVGLTLASNSGNLTKTDHTFAGWNTAADGSGTNYATGATYTANAAVTLYAKWNTQFDVWVNESGGGGGGGETVTFTGDSNTDGVPDGVAWLLGTDSLTNNATEILPVPQQNNGAVSVNFDYLTSAVRGAAKLKLQYSATLQPNSWTTVEIPAVSSTVDGVEFVITPIPDTNLYDVQATVPASAAGGGGKVFVRLMGEVISP